jgi:acylphosphatase
MAEASEARKAVRVLYRGKVQGVGFRATAVLLAQDYAVSGWVRNLRDGSVELWAEGPEAEVESFLTAIRDHWQGYVSDEERTPQEPTGEHDGFEVRR